MSVRDGVLEHRVTGTRAIGWWGILLLVVIESAVFASLVFAYFYLRLAVPAWPPAGIDPPELLLPSVNAAILLSSALPMHWALSGIRHGDHHRLGLGLSAGIAIAVVFLALKVIEYADTATKYIWSDNAYASIVWTITGFHTLHVVAMILKSAPMALLAFRGHFNELQHAVIDGTVLYWTFVVAVWMPLFATLYLVPRLT